MLQLGQVILPLLSSDPSDECIRECVYVFQRIAGAYLRVKVRNGRLDPNVFGISLDDLALDCIAELFERSADGRFPELVDYYSPLKPSSCSQVDWLGATRRIVFSKVNEGLFRMYKEHDRSLSNTIRNLKNALRFSRALVTVTRSGESWVQLNQPKQSKDGLPLLPSEFIEARLMAESDHRRTLRELTEAFAGMLREQELYQRQYPLVGLALVIRSLNVRSLSVDEEISTETGQFRDDEVNAFVESSVNRTKSTMKQSYVGKGKLDQRTFNVYFDCVGDILKAEYVRNDGIDLTYYETLRNRMKDLSESQYRRQHRVYLEYLAKLTRKNFLKSIKSEFQL